MQKKYIFVTTAALVILMAGAFTYKVYAEKNNGVAAIVNGEEITVADIRKAYEQNPQIKAQASFEDFYEYALDVLVNNKLTLQAANKANIKATPEYQKMLTEAQDEIARQVYIEQAVLSRINEAEVRKMYDEYVSKFKSEKEIKAKHILVDEEDLAKNIIKQLDDKTASFDDLAKKYSKDQPELGYFSAEAMVPEFSEAAFALEKGTYSKEPVKTEFGYHVILVEDIRDTQPLAFDEIEDQLKLTLSRKAFNDVLEELNNNAKIEKFDLSGKKISEDKK